jgi:mono/diheme cytochrome c family protein
MFRPARPGLFLAALTTAATAAAQDVDAVASGEHLFRLHCSACHGDDGAAGASGDIRGLTRATFDRALRGIEQMPSFAHLDAAEIEALADWLRIAPAP